MPLLSWPAAARSNTNCFLWQHEACCILQELKEHLDDLKKAAESGPERLLDHVYNTHPPANPAHKQMAYSPDNVKKLLQAAISHYHPDRMHNRRDGDRTFVLCEEICKALTAKYTSCK